MKRQDFHPNEEQKENLKQRCLNVLQPLREYYQNPIKISSGFRSAKLSEAIGSSANSQHCKGEAADFELIGHDNLNVASHIKNNFQYDQLILEYYDGTLNSGWIHCSYSSRNNRKMALKKDKNGYKEWV